MVKAPATFLRNIKLKHICLKLELKHTLGLKLKHMFSAERGHSAEKEEEEREKEREIASDEAISMRPLS